MVARGCRRKSRSKATYGFRKRRKISGRNLYGDVVAAVRVDQHICRALKSSKRVRVKRFPVWAADEKVFFCLKRARKWLNHLRRQRLTASLKLKFHHPLDNASTEAGSKYIPYNADTHRGLLGVTDMANPHSMAGSARAFNFVFLSTSHVVSAQVEASPKSTDTQAIYDRTDDVQPLEVAAEESNAPTPLIAQDSIAHYGQDLSEEQRKVLKVVAEGKSVFFTGAAGTGKSVTLRAIINMMKFKYKGQTQALAITASTGIAAMNIGGQTLHSFSRVGLGKQCLRKLIKQVKNNQQARDNWRTVEAIIIDEISMVDGTFFDKLEAVARVLRRNNKPFGGIQLIICGDFFQLPPVPDRYMGAPVPATFAFDALSWRRCIRHQMRLTQVFRQANPVFVNLLNRMRIGQVDQDMITTIMQLERDIEHNGIQPVQIYPLNAQVISANTRQLGALPGSIFSYTAQDRGRWLERELGGDRDAHDIRISKLLDTCSIALRKIVLKEGAQVMLIRNLVQGELVNGSLGRVVLFTTCREARAKGIRTATKILEDSLEARAKSDGRSLDELLRFRMRGFPTEMDGYWPVVEFVNAQKVHFTPIPFDTEDAFGDLEATRVQIPLILAWAITIHKSQGRTIEKLKIDFKGTFEMGQAYVAMSRATGLSTLQVLNFNPMLVRAHPHVVAWHSNLLLEEEMDDEGAIASYFSHN